MTTSAPTRGVHDLLAQLALELSTLQSMADEVETSVAQLLGREDAALDARGIQNLQLLDILNQSLRALSTCCANAARLAGPAWTIDGSAVIGGIELACIAQRLAGRDAVTGTDSEGGCEMFTGR